MQSKKACATATTSPHFWFKGQPQNAAPINRVPAALMEQLIVTAVRNHLELNKEKLGSKGPNPIADVDLTATHIARVDVKQSSCHSVAGTKKQ
jgi:hypothetical protein